MTPFDQRGAPECPRCRSAINVIRAGDLGVPCVQPALWTCRWCLFQVWAADVIEQTRRLHKELDRITRETPA
jgi:hypothetical protein